MSYLNEKSSVSIVAGDKIGDSLISMVFARNFHENGYATTIFSSRLCELAALFPGYNIRPSLPEEQRYEVLEPFDLRLFPANGEFLRHKDPALEELLIKKSRKIFHQQKLLPDVFKELSHYIFRLPKTFRTPGMLPPPGTRGKYKKRIVIHPTSSCLDKNWQRKKFLSVADQLKKRGLEPIFALAPFEVPDWEDCGIPIAAFESLTETASFLYESAFFIGNDSGLGHLASSVGLKTLTLCPRKKQGVRWGPAWGQSEILYPWLHLPGPRMKELFWRHFISTRRVLKMLDAHF